MLSSLCSTGVVGSIAQMVSTISVQPWGPWKLAFKTAYVVHQLPLYNITCAVGSIDEQFIQLPVPLFKGYPDSLVYQASVIFLQRNWYTFTTPFIKCPHTNGSRQKDARAENRIPRQFGQSAEMGIILPAL